MPDGWYQGFILTPREEPRTGSEAAFRVGGVKDGSVVFTVVSAADYTTSAKLEEAAEDLAIRYGIQYAHGLIDLERYEPGAVHEVTVAPDPPHGSITDSELESELLNALRRMARVASSTALIPFLDVDGIAAVLDIDSQQVSAVLGEMALSGWIEGHAETFAAGLTEGRCLLTPSGLAEAKRRVSPIRVAAPNTSRNHPKERTSSRCSTYPYRSQAKTATTLKRQFALWRRSASGSSTTSTVRRSCGERISRRSSITCTQRSPEE